MHGALTNPCSSQRKLWICSHEAPASCCTGRASARWCTVINHDVVLPRTMLDWLRRPPPAPETAPEALPLRGTPRRLTRIRAPPSFWRPSHRPCGFGSLSTEVPFQDTSSSLLRSLYVSRTQQVCSAPASLGSHTSSVGMRRTHSLPTTPLRACATRADLPFAYCTMQRAVHVGLPACSIQQATS